MKTGLFIFVLALILGWTAVGLAGPVEEILPADTDFVILIEDVPAFMEHWEASPWAQIWEDPGFSPLFDVLKDDKTGKARWNLEDPSLSSLLEAVRGEAALVSPDLGLLMDDKDGKEGPWALIGELSLSESGLLEILDREVEGEDAERDVDGIQVRFRVTEDDSTGMEKETLAWAQVEETAVVGQSSSYVAEVVHSLRSGPPEAGLAGVSEWKAMKSRNPGADIYFYFNIRDIVGLVQEGMEEGMAENPQATMMGLSGTRVSEALGLDAFRVFYASCKQDDREVTLDFGMHYTPGRGLPAILGQYSGPAPRPGFIPENVLAASSARYDYSKAWDAFLDVIDAINPDIAGMLRAQLQQVSMNLGMDLEQDVIRNLGDETFSAYFPAGENAMEADQVFGITIRDPERLQSAIDGLLTKMGTDAETVQTRMLGKATVYTVTGPGAEMGKTFSLTVYKGRLVVGVGSPDALAPMLRSMDKPGPSVWERKDLTPLFARLPRDASSVGYYDMGSFLQTAVGTQMDHLKEKDPDSPAVEDMSEVDWERLSRYFGPMVAATVQTDQGMFGKGYLILREP